MGGISMNALSLCQGPGSILQVQPQGRQQASISDATASMKDQTDGASDPRKYHGLASKALSDTFGVIFFKCDVAM